MAMAEVAEFHSSDTDDEEVEDDASLWSHPCASQPAVVRDLHPGGEQSPHLERRPADPGIFLPVFTPSVHHLSSIHIDGQIPLDSDSESSYMDDQVTLALDLFDGCSPRPESGGASQMDFSSNFVDSFSIGVFDGVEDMGSDYLELGPELGLGFGLEKPEDEGGGAGTDSDDDEGLDLGGDGFFVGGGRMTSAPGAADSEPSRSPEGEGLRIVGFGSDSESDEEIEIACRMRTNLEGGDVPDVGLPLPWDSLRIEEERGDPNEDFDWEEVEVTMNEREVVGTVFVDEDSSIASEEENPVVEWELQEGEGGAIHTVEWEVLLAMNNLDRNAPVEPEDAESYQGEEHNDYHIHTSEYEVLFDQVVDHDNFIKGGPPAAKLVIERLPSVVLTQLDVANNNTFCAVCKDEISLEEKAKRLPCSHHYHTGCILPWLRIRNTCPVCRHELPTDDANYENWRSWRAASSVAVEDSQVRYEIGMFPGE
ncbi:hypothetical protein Taro_049284 [Colocasia esculenta]|uniref:RING-type E3 ubiquitin transferase n=1 Tax=Colocasia esculenta TaxID=4460 RepID=A0A843XAF0_COLES|nr:hypothetical protein [Colocasia esculenta]